MTHLLVAGKLHPTGVARLDALRFDGIKVTYLEEINEPSVAEHIATADALVIRTQPLSAATIALAERLKVVSRHGVGYDAVDVEALNARGIPLAIVSDVNSVSVAEQAMMQLSGRCQTGDPRRPRRARSIEMGMAQPIGTARNFRPKPVDHRLWPCGAKTGADGRRF